MTGNGPLLGPKAKPLQDLRRLSGRRRARSEAGAFVIDGPTLIAEALDAGITIASVVVEPRAPTDLVERVVAAGIAVHRVGEGALARVTDPVTPQPMAAVAAIPTPVDPRLGGLVLVLVGVGDPGNAGTLVRAAEASGAAAVVSCGDGVDIWSPKCVRSSAGSSFRIPVVDAGDAEQGVALLRSAGMTLVATEPHADTVLDDVDLTGDVAVLLGSEAHGLPAAVAAACDVRLSIPMVGRVESLNVATCGAVIAFESARQRRARTSS